MNARHAAFAALLLATPAAFAQSPATDPVLERGRYLARLGDCVSCHSAPGAAPFSGGLPMNTPFGTVISTNITPDPQAGIGAYSEAEFARALREGVARDGHRLYPAMPYPAFARTTDEDVHALYVFFQKGVQASDHRPPATLLRWPFSMRPLLVFWNWLYLDKGPYENDASRSAQWNRGAYLVTGLGHCGDCHTPRGRLGATLARDERGGNAYLSGAVIDGWFAQPLRHAKVPTAAQWTAQDIADYLKTGRTAHTATFGPMVSVVGNSTQHLSAEDLGAIATYLQSLGAPPGAAAPTESPQARMVAAAPATPAAQQLRDGKVAALPGSMVYLNNCAACHRSSGIGWDRTFPALSGNSVVGAHDPTSLIRIVLSGSSMPATNDAPTAFAMPGLGWRLKDEDVAQVLSFVRSSWGNEASPVTAAQVAAVRATLPAPPAADASATK